MHSETYSNWLYVYHLAFSCHSLKLALQIDAGASIASRT